MTSRTAGDPRRTRPRRVARGVRPRIAWMCFAAAVVVLIAVVVCKVWGFRPAPTPQPSLEDAPAVAAPAAAAPPQDAAASVAPTPAAPAPDAQKLVGRWVRVDAPYVIRITSVADNGSLDAAYYNPRSINVARAESRLVEGRLEVVIELRDVNYPGSTYTLTCDPTGNRLQGVYYQAALRESYDVTFVRAARGP